MTIKEAKEYVRIDNKHIELEEYELFTIKFALLELVKNLDNPNHILYDEKFIIKIRNLVKKLSL